VVSHLVLITFNLNSVVVSHLVLITFNLNSVSLAT